MKSVNKSVACSFSALPWASSSHRSSGLTEDWNRNSSVAFTTDLNLNSSVASTIGLNWKSSVSSGTPPVLPRPTVTPVNSIASILAPPKLIRFRTSAVTEADPGAELETSPKGLRPTLIAVFPPDACSKDSALRLASLQVVMSSERGTSGGAPDGVSTSPRLLSVVFSSVPSLEIESRAEPESLSGLSSASSTGG